jgi:hypothetical protein
MANGDAPVPDGNSIQTMPHMWGVTMQEAADNLLRAMGIQQIYYHDPEQPLSEYPPMPEEDIHI